jgi:hypothetical protein
MTKNTVVMRAALLIGMSWAVSCGAAGSSKAGSCSEVLTRVVPVQHPMNPAKEAAHLEIRRCEPTPLGQLQIWLYETNSPKPTLIVDTDDFLISAVAATRFGAVIETERGSYATVQVFSLNRGHWKLEAQETVRDPASIRIEGGEILVKIPVWREKERTIRLSGPTP